MSTAPTETPWPQGPTLWTPREGLRGEPAGAGTRGEQVRPRAPEAELADSDETLALSEPQGSDPGSGVTAATTQGETGQRGPGAPDSATYTCHPPSAPSLALSAGHERQETRSAP